MSNDYLSSSSQILLKYKNVIGEADRIEIFLLLADKRMITCTTLPITEFSEKDAFLTCLAELDLKFEIKSDPDIARYQDYIQLNNKMGCELRLTYSQYCAQKEIIIGKNHYSILMYLNNRGYGFKKIGEMLGYPETAVESFDTDKKRCIELLKKDNDIKHLFEEVYLLPVADYWKLLQSEFKNELFVWYVHHVRLSKESEKYLKELEVLKDWYQVLSKYKII